MKTISGVAGLIICRDFIERKLVELVAHFLYTAIEKSSILERQSRELLIS